MSPRQDRQLVIQTVYKQSIAKFLDLLLPVQDFQTVSAEGFTPVFQQPVRRPRRLAHPPAVARIIHDGSSRNC